MDGVLRGRVLGNTLGRCAGTQRKDRACAGTSTQTRTKETRSKVVTVCRTYLDVLPVLLEQRGQEVGGKLHVELDLVLRPVSYTHLTLPTTPYV